jgi:hypothetical protein
VRNAGPRPAGPREGAITMAKNKKKDKKDKKNKKKNKK